MGSLRVVTRQHQQEESRPGRGSKRGRHIKPSWSQFDKPGPRAGDRVASGPWVNTSPGGRVGGARVGAGGMTLSWSAYNLVWQTLTGSAYVLYFADRTYAEGWFRV